MSNLHVDRVIDLTFMGIREESEYTDAFSEKLKQYRSRSPPRRASSPNNNNNDTSGGSPGSPGSPGRSQCAITDRRQFAWAIIT